MDIKVTVTLATGRKVRGRLTTNQAASSYGMPIFVDDNNQVYNWLDIVHIDTATDMRVKGGSATSPAKRAASAANGRRGGRPRKKPS